MAHLTDFLGNPWPAENDCLGCAIGNGTVSVPGGIIYKTTHFYVNQDPLIPLPGFLVIAATRHIQSISDMGASEYEEFSALLKTTHQAIKEVTKIEYLTLVQEERSKHFPFMVFPLDRKCLGTVRETLIDQDSRNYGCLSTASA